MSSETCFFSNVTLDEQVTLACIITGQSTDGPHRMCVCVHVHVLEISLPRGYLRVLVHLLSMVLKCSKKSRLLENYISADIFSYFINLSLRVQKSYTLEAKCSSLVLLSV